MVVPFSVECYGAWGPAATSLFEVATAHLHNYRDTEFFHWSSARITNYWATALGVCLTREHADIIAMPTPRWSFLSSGEYMYNPQTAVHRRSCLIKGVAG